MPGSLISGVVLAGGRSRRMRRTKATLRSGRELLWQRQSRVLRSAGCRPVLLALRPRQRSLGDRAREIRDQASEAGPLAGLHAALAAGDAPLLAVLAVDMPRIEPAWFRQLLRHARPGRGAVFAGPDGLEPLAAVYPREALPVAGRRLRRRQLAVHRLVAELVRARRMKVLPLPAALRPQAANWNRPGDPGRAAPAASRPTR